jgi:hypothetical protein
VAAIASCDGGSSATMDAGDSVPPQYIRVQLVRHSRGDGVFACIRGSNCSVYSVFSVVKFLSLRLCCAMPFVCSRCGVVKFCKNFIEDGSLFKKLF